MKDKARSDEEVLAYIIYALLITLFALPLLLGAKGCSESDKCRAAREAARLVCDSAPESVSCTTAKQAVIDLCKPEPDPTPTPPAPVNCLTHPSCKEGEHCEQGIGCVPDPLPDPEPIECRQGEIPVIVDGEVVRCDPAPVTAPDPQPVPDPPATTCPAQPCPDRSKGAWQLKCKVHGRDKADCTPVTVRQEPFCRAIGMSPMADGTLRAGCPMRPDGHPERSAVEAWVTGGTKLEARNGATCELVDGNPFQFWQAGGNCRLCSADGLTCGEWM